MYNKFNELQRIQNRYEKVKEISELLSTFLDPYYLDKEGNYLDTKEYNTLCKAAKILEKSVEYIYDEANRSFNILKSIN